MATVFIRKDSCKSCGYCVKFCPKGVLQIGKAVNGAGHAYAVVAAPEKCVQCAMCAQICPDAAIELKEEAQA